MRARLPNAFDPARFQGARQRRGYFEGYYFKVVDPDLDLALALIPGVSFDERGAGHAFVQVIDGVAEAAAYHRFDLREFAAFRYGARVVGETCTAGAVDSESSFALCIGPNGFGESGLSIELPGLRGRLAFRQNRLWPWRPWSPGAMGPFSFVPGMQCKHGILSLHHGVAGTLALGTGTAGAPARELTLGPRAVGYLEKDWGSGFPRRWTWLQTNHLDGVDGPCCLTVSRGVVPWVTGAFEGFIVGLLGPWGLARFTTYNGASCRQTVEGDTLRLDLRRGRERLTIETPVPWGGATLAAPQTLGGMSGKVNECLTARAKVEYRVGGRTVLSTAARYVGVELGGAG